MDHNSIPECALYRNIGTVIVRLKMEVTTSCCNVCPLSGCPDVVHRPSGCEQCNRTRLISKYSDCDSGVVEKSRPYRSSAARSRYINVCAAVCLLLLFGGLSPRSSAAPHRRIMERQRRATDSEYYLWGNPCDYKNDSNSKRDPPDAHEIHQVAVKLVKQAGVALTTTARYKDTFASELHSFSKFDNLLATWEKHDWLRKFDWMPDEGFPKEKILYQNMSDEYMNGLMEKIDDVLPGMYKGLKMIVAGLYAFADEGLNADIPIEFDLKENINLTMNDVRAVLCYFSDIMKARKLTILPLPDSEAPHFKTPDTRLIDGLLLYRDTLNYLEYLGQVFQKLYETK